MDPRRFLGRTQRERLPVVDGRHAEGRTRAHRLTAEVAPGWWEVELSGRLATAIAPAEPEPLSSLPRRTGPTCGGLLFLSGSEAAPLRLLPAEEFAPFSPATARLWRRDLLLFETQPFEGESEEPLRHALEEELPIGSLAGISAAQRAAYGWALLLKAQARLALVATPGELRLQLGEIASGGAAGAEAALRRLAEERRRHRPTVGLEAVRALGAWNVPPTASPRDRLTAEQDAERALDRAEARLRRTRRLEGELLEVAFDLDGERFVSVVRLPSLQVVDSGVCLAGADDLVTLESLPGVLRQAMREGALVITRWDR